MMIKKFIILIPISVTIGFSLLGLSMLFGGLSNDIFNVKELVNAVFWLIFFINSILFISLVVLESIFADRDV